MPLEGQQLGRYRLLSLIGSGGTGKVYLAEDSLIICAIILMTLLVILVGCTEQTGPSPLVTVEPGASGCQLHSANGVIQHVIYIQFDNTHFTRDNPNVPSDLEQMPNLL